MRLLLQLLSDPLSFLFDEAGYWIVDGGETGSFGDAWVMMQSDRMALLLVRDKSQVFLECTTLPIRGRSSDWFGTDIIMEHLGEPQEEAMLDDFVVSWFQRNLREIEERFAPDSAVSTIADLSTLRRKKSRRRLG